MTPTAGISIKDPTLTYSNYYKKLAKGVYNSTTVSTVFWKATMNSLKYYGIPLAAKVFIVLAAVAVTTTPPGWVIIASAIGSLVITHLEIRLFVWATKNCDKNSWLGWLHNMYATNIKNIDHEFRVLLALNTRVLTYFLGWQNHHIVHESERFGSIFQGSLPNRVSSDALDLKKSNIQAILSFHEEWELTPCFLSVPYLEEDWKSLGIEQKNIIPKDDKLDEEQVNEALNFMRNCALKKINVYIHGNSSISKKIIELHLKSSPLNNSPLSTNRETPLNKPVTFHEDGSFDYLNDQGELKTEPANWMNGDKATRKRALEKIFKNEPNSDKLIRDSLSKLGQPLAGGKIGRKIQLLNMTLVSQSYCSWKAANNSGYGFST